MPFLDAARSLLGDDYVLTGEACAPYLTDWRKRFHGTARAVMRPGTTQQVADLVRLCAQHRVPVVPQGGNTGLAGGATPDASGLAVVLSLTRLDRVREVDTDNDTITVEAGCVLQTLQERAEQAGRLFPLSLASEGTCTVGGNLSTNAGGTQVLRYGNARELTLGLEVVTAQGDIWHGLRGLRKDNTGYDLRDLFIGSEGTLGVITAATLRLYPQPVAACVALVAVRSVRDAVQLLTRARGGFGAALTGFELMSGASLELVTRIFTQQRMPLGPSSWYVLLELSDNESEAHAQSRFHDVLRAALEDDLVQDVAIAVSLAQAKAFWHLRESISLAQSTEGKNIKHDISLPISRIADFVHTTDALLQNFIPGVRNITFGHLGDGNLHYNVARPANIEEVDFLARQNEVYLRVHDSVAAHGGSISAEHGIGQLKREELRRYKSPVELALMQQIKQALDPLGLMNPGKVLAVD